MSRRYDALAFRYVSWFAIPCLAGYTIYSLLYETHRGWYSFVISTLTSFVYMFGFVSTTVDELLWQGERLTAFDCFQAQLIPQLIINYKLKVRRIVVWTLVACMNIDDDHYLERRTHADEGDGVQDIVDCSR